MRWLRWFLRTPLLVVGMPVVMMMAYFWFVCDDAYITWRYARNVVNGFGLRYNLGHHVPIEGYSNFLWIWPAALVETLGWDPARWIPLLSCTLSVWMLYILWRFLRIDMRVGQGVTTVAVLGLGMSPVWLTWSSSGLASVPFAMLLWFTLYYWGLSANRLGWIVGALAAVALALIRAEGTGWVLVIAALSVLARFLDMDRDAFRSWLKRFLVGLTMVVLALGTYHGWRYAYFGTLVPNTARVKVAFGPERLLRGLKYVLLMYLTLPGMAVWLLGIPNTLGWRRGAGTALSLMAIGVPTYAVVVGGDYMPFGRLLAPGLPFAVVVAACGLQRAIRHYPQQTTNYYRIAMIAIGVDMLAGMGMVLAPRVIRESLNIRLTDRNFMEEAERLQNMRENTAGFLERGELLRERLPSNARIVAQAIGAVGYVTELYIYDQYGLVTREVADRPTEAMLEHSPGHDKLVPAEFFAEYEPTLLHHKLIDGEHPDRIVRRVMARWDVPPALHDEYVPELESLSQSQRATKRYLLWVRRSEPGEDTQATWDAYYEALERL